jgi:hypothetical protein
MKVENRLECRISCGADHVVKNVWPYLLPLNFVGSYIYHLYARNEENSDSSSNSEEDDDELDHDSSNNDEDDDNNDDGWEGMSGEL